MPPSPRTIHQHLPSASPHPTAGTTSAPHPSTAPAVEHPSAADFARAVPELAHATLAALRAVAALVARTTPRAIAAVAPRRRGGRAVAVSLALSLFAAPLALPAAVAATPAAASSSAPGSPPSHSAADLAAPASLWSPDGAANLAARTAELPADLDDATTTVIGLALGTTPLAQRARALDDAPAPLRPRLAAAAHLVDAGSAASGLDPVALAQHLAAAPPHAVALVATAAAWDGTRERGRNLTPFASLARHPNGAPWCATFTVASAALAGVALPPRTSPTAAVDDPYTVYQRAGWRAAGAWVDAGPDTAAATARTGDFVYYRWAGDGDPTSHVGLVAASLPDGRLLTVEGNVGAAGGSDAGGPEGVHVMARTTTSVVGFGRPAFDTTPPGWATPTTP